MIYNTNWANENYTIRIENYRIKTLHNINGQVQILPG